MAARLCGLGGDLDYIDFMLWKAGVLCVAAFGWGIYCGVTGRPLGLGQHEEDSSPAGREPAKTGDASPPPLRLPR